MAPSPRPPRYRQSVSSFLAATATTIAVTLPSAVLAGSLLIVRTNWGATSQTCTVAGNSNSFATAVAKFTNVNLTASMQVFYAQRAVVGSTTITATFTATSTNRLIEVLEYTGMDAVNPLTTSANGSSSVTGTALSTAAVGLGAQAGFYTQHTYVGTSISAFGSFTSREAAGSNNGGDLLNQAPNASVAGGATQTTAAHWMMSCIAWKYGGPPDVPPLRAPSRAAVRSAVW